MIDIDDTWGLTWSGRWHKINSEPPYPGYYGRDSYGLCGTPVYRQTEVLGKDPASLYRVPIKHLAKIVDSPDSAPVCKKCEKKLAATR